MKNKLMVRAASGKWYYVTALFEKHINCNTDRNGALNATDIKHAQEKFPKLVFSTSKEQFANDNV